MFKMSDLPSRPSSLLKFLAVAARATLWLLLAAWLVMISAWGALHLFIVPRIGELRPQLESRATQMLGVTVRIGAIEARSDEVVPSFELRDVRLFDPQGREALHLPRVLAALSPRSLWRFGFEQLYVERPQLAVRRAADGRIFVAGLDLSQSPDSDGQALDWFFSQTEFLIRGGTVQWTDEQRNAPPLALEQVDLVLRNTARGHAFRLDVTPPAAWGQRLTLMAQFRQPLLTTRAGQWRKWQGQLYAESAHLDVLQLQPYADLGVDVAQGRGAVRAWVDVRDGELVGATADVALSQLQVTLTPRLGALSLASLNGRLGGRVLQGGFEFSTQDLQFEMADGLRWPGGNLRLVHVAAEGRVPARGELQADRLDLAALARIAERLPLEEQVHAALARHAPQGLVERIQASWQGSLEAPERFDVKGRVTQLALAAGRAAQGKGAASAPETPGVRGASVDFDLNQSGGRATVALQDGQLVLPGVFEAPVLDFARLSSDVQWQHDGGRLSVQLPNLKFSNADAQGEAQLKWQTGTDGARGRLPGVLDLQGSLSRADASRVHRYLPLEIEREVRDYLRGAIAQGRVSNVRFRVKGDLHDFPFANPKQGEFRVTASVRDATFAYLPRSLQAAGELPWPALTQFNGELLIDHASLQLKDVDARLAGAPGVRISRADAQIPNLMQGATLTVNAEAKGPLGEFLDVLVNGSPLGAMTGQGLRQASASGAADVQFKLKLPLLAAEKTEVQGKVTLGGNDLQLAPDLPRLSRARGAVYFSETGFAISGGQARALGGDLRAEGGTIPVPGARTSGPALLRVQGNLTAEGLRQARELGALAQLAQQASGGTNYTLLLGLRRGVPELQISSTLQGLALNLPAPLRKSAEAALPLRLETALTREAQSARAPLQDQLTFELGRLVTAVYVRDVSGPQAHVLRGALGIGLAPGEQVPLPAEGVAASFNLPSLDVDAWNALVSAAPAPAAAASSRPASVAVQARGYLPTSLAVRARELTATGRTLHQVVLGGTREGPVWRANLDAQELSGYLEYREATGSSAGRVYARLARLSLAPSSARDVETLLDEQPVSIPALDIVVEDMELRGRKLGRVEIEAVNRGASLAARGTGAREWRLNRFNILLPEASFTATGNWALLNESAATAGRSVPERRRTVMNFKLELADAGALLGRFGMKDVIRRGKGRLEGQIAWVGSPLALDYPTLGGAFNVNVENGQFLKADPGIAKLLGVLSLQSLPRRLTLDFRDVFSEGFSFDFVRGDVRIEQGIALTNNLQMKGVNAAVLMEGRVDLARETQDLRVVVVPEINAGTASLIAGWINPAVGLGSFLAQLVLRRPLIDSATEQFHVTGSWTDPKITRADTPATGKTENSPEGAR